MKIDLEEIREKRTRLEWCYKGLFAVYGAFTYFGVQQSRSGLRLAFKLKEMDYRITICNSLIYKHRVKKMHRLAGLKPRKCAKRK